jgi:hypothetical protein
MPELAGRTAVLILAILPAWRTSDVDPSTSLKIDSRSITSSRAQTRKGASYSSGGDHIRDPGEVIEANLASTDARASGCLFSSAQERIGKIKGNPYYAKIL